MTQEFKMKKMFALHPPGMYVSVPEGYKRGGRSSQMIREINSSLNMYISKVQKLSTSQ